MKKKESAKRIVALLLALIMATMCIACSGGDDVQNDENSDETENVKQVHRDNNEKSDIASDDDTQRTDNFGDDETDGPSEPVIEEKTIRLEQCKSIGEVGFDKIDVCPYPFDQQINYGRTEMIYFTNCTSDLFPFRYNERWGYINENGEIVLKDQWDMAFVFSEGKAFVQDGDEWEVIDAEGNVLFSIEETLFTGGTGLSTVSEFDIYYSHIPYYKNGIAVEEISYKVGEHPKKTDSYWSINVDVFNSIILTITDTFQFNSFEGQTLTNNDDDFYYRTHFMTGSVNGFIIEMIPYNNDLVGNYYKIYDSSGELLFQCSNCSYIGDKYILTSWNDIIDITTGDVVFEFEYEKCGTLSDGVIPVCSYDKWGLIDTEGNVLIKPTYAYLSKFSHGLGFALDLDGNGLLINKSGETVAYLPYKIFGEYDSIDVESFTDSGFIYVSNDDDEGFLVNEKGEIIFSGNEDDFKYISASYVVYGDDLYKVVVE